MPTCIDLSVKADTLIRVSDIGWDPRPNLYPSPWCNGRARGALCSEARGFESCLGQEMPLQYVICLYLKLSVQRPVMGIISSLKHFRQLNIQYQEQYRHTSIK